MLIELNEKKKAYLHDSSELQVNKNKTDPK